MKSRLFALLLVLCLCLGFAGCARNDVEDNPSNNPSQESTDGTQDTSEPTNDTSESEVKKEELTEDQVTALTKIIGEIAPLDYLGRSVKPAELPNEELLRVCLYMYNPRHSGFASDTSEWVITRKTTKYFGIETVTLDPTITCSCGQTIATYDSGNDCYGWDVEDTHYLEHTAEAYNELIEAYKLEDLYYVEMYKIFPDLTKNTNSDKMNFYATYADAEKKENALFSAANETEFASALEGLDDAKKVKYTYVFKADDSGKKFVLQEYIIGE